MVGSRDGAARAAALGEAEKLCTLSAGVFFLTALLTGVWKWRGMATRKGGQAHKCAHPCRYRCHRYRTRLLLQHAYCFHTPT